jgi:hypothetical protein
LFICESNLKSGFFTDDYFPRWKHLTRAPRTATQ